jgi:ankyrin repeat protein
LPETLDETYQRTLREINKADWEFTHRLFQFVVVASRPLRAEELAELLAFDFEAGPIPKFHEDLRLEDPVNAVLSACSSLLAVVDVEGSPVIQFSHFSVKEFLTSARLAEARDDIHRRYHVSMTSAHTLASQACLGTLLHLDKDVITRDNLGDYPLAEYAAEHWVYHAQFEEVWQNVEDGMKQLFDPSKPHLTVCIWIHNPEYPWVKGNARDERPSPNPRSPLHYAAFWGLHPIVHFLVIELSQDVRSRNIIDDTTPLHLASQNGHKQVVCFLLEHGADVSARGYFGATPLSLALHSGHVGVAHILVERGADVSARDRSDTPLHLALSQGHVEVAHMLIEHGADVLARDGRRKTPLHLASYAGYAEVAHMLVKSGADISAQDCRGETPLHVASKEGHVEVAHMLIERGADVSAQGMERETPLHLASRWGRVEVAHILIESGADATAQNKDRKTPLHLASTCAPWTIPQQFAEVARILLEHGANVAAQDNDGLTPLDLASQDKGLAEVSHVLIQHGACPGVH